HWLEVQRCLLLTQSGHEQRPGVGASANYRSEITSPLRSAATISPIWRPDSVSTAPFWFASTIPPAPGPTATPAPAAPYTPLTSNGVRILLTVPTKSVAAAPKVNPHLTPTIEIRSQRP